MTVRSNVGLAGSADLRGQRVLTMFDAIRERMDGTIDPTTNTRFQDAQSFAPRRDPLVLDLDGDGLELITANGTVLFDHNADGIKTGTGWAAR